MKFYNNVISTLLLFCLIPINLAIALDPDQYENDNSHTNATLIEAGVKQVHTIAPSKEEDWVTFTLDKTEYVQLRTKGLRHTRLFLFDSDLARIAVSNGFAAGLIQKKLNAGTYFVAITDTGGRYNESQYTLSLTTSSGSGDIFESNNTYKDATLIYGGFTQTHSIIPANDVDYIKFHLSAEDTVVLRTTGEFITRIWLYDNNYTKLAVSNGYRHGYVRKTLKPGTYYVRITGGRHIEEYRFHLTTTVEHDGEPPVETPCNRRR